MNKLTHLYLQEVLDKIRLDVLEKLIQIKEMWFILWWWTWLALMFGHRESIDFDFFIPKNLDTIKLFEKCLDIFSWFEIIKTFEEKNTLYISVNWVKISFFPWNKTEGSIKTMQKTPETIMNFNKKWSFKYSVFVVAFHNIIQKNNNAIKLK